MRQARLIYVGALHHCLNHGIHGEAIWAGNSVKSAFLEFMAKKVKLFRLPLFTHVSTHARKWLTGKLLVRLRDQSGLKFRDINEVRI